MERTTQAIVMANQHGPMAFFSAELGPCLQHQRANGENKRRDYRTGNTKRKKKRIQKRKKLKKGPTEQRKPIKEKVSLVLSRLDWSILVTVTLSSSADPFVAALSHFPLDYKLRLSLARPSSLVVPVPRPPILHRAPNAIGVCVQQQQHLKKKE